MQFTFKLYSSILSILLCCALCTLSSTAFAKDLSIASVTASSDDGNIPENTIDNDLSTRWSAEGDGQWIEYDLGATYSVSQVFIAFFLGDQRSTQFDIQTSNDQNLWTTVFSGSSSGLTLQQETFNIQESVARYIRIVGHGNSVSAWNSLTEVNLSDSTIPSPVDFALATPDDATEPPPPSPGDTVITNLVTKDNITWTFNGDYPTGQFISGDWYVVAPSGLQITNIAASGGETLAGSMLNPDPNVGNQGFSDTTGMSTVVPYDPSLNVGTSLPLSLSPGDMLVTTTKYNYYGVTNPENQKNYTHVNEAAILTILPTAPASGSFRPGLCDTSRTIYNESDINYTLFATLPPVSNAPPLGTIADMVARPWLDFIPGWMGRQIHPNNNMKDYGGEISVDLATIALILNSNYPNTDKAPIARGFIQIGLDCWSIVKRNPTRYQMDVAHNVGRKLPILLTGELMNIAEIKDIWVKAGDYVNSTGYGTYPADAYLFSEDMAINYVVQGDIDATTSGTAAYSPDVNYSSSLLNMPEWFHYPYAYRYRSTAHWTADTYRLCCYSGTLEGDAIVIYAMGLKNKWNHQAFFDYMDRFVAIADGNADPFGYTVPGEVSGYRGSWQSNGAWMSAMWDAYRADFN